MTSIRSDGSPLETRVDDRGVLWVGGDLDLSTATRFATAAAEALDGRRELEIDLGGVAFMDSSGVRAVLETAMRAGRGVVLRRPSEQVGRVLVMLDVVGRYGIRLE